MCRPDGNTKQTEGLIDRLLCHVRPDPDEVPPPALPVRNRDLIAYNAYVTGMEEQDRWLADGRPVIEAYEAGWLAAAEYFRKHDRRRNGKTALDEVL